MAKVNVSNKTNRLDGRLKPAYATSRGILYRTSIEKFLASPSARELRGKVALILTSPPFPLRTKKKYGNLEGSEYLSWLEQLAPQLRLLLKANGSIVIELGNAWERGHPVMSTLALEALLAFAKAGDFYVCQQFVCHNPARLPGPAQWVNVERIRVKDAFTHVWWMSLSERPYANNRKILIEYSAAMKSLMKRRKYNAGARPSEHHIRPETFFRDNGGAIPSNVLTFSNTQSHEQYLIACRKNGWRPHPARMPKGLAEFFIRFLTVPRNLVLDPFAGSNTTGAVAEALGRRWLAVEPLREYVLASRSRFKKKG